MEAGAPGRDLVRAMSALADENRFRIVRLLALRADALSCSAISNALGLSPSLLSHHLSVLEDAEIVERRKQGVCTLNHLRRDQLSRHIGELCALADGAPGQSAQGTMEVAVAPPVGPAS